jgi:hypothetical protein
VRFPCGDYQTLLEPGHFGLELWEKCLPKSVLTCDRPKSVLVEHNADATPVSPPVFTYEAFWRTSHVSVTSRRIRRR